MPDFAYHRPVTITELKEHLNQPGARLIAGGTDILPQMQQGKFSASILVDTSGIQSLRFIEDRGKEILLGALTTHQEIVDSILLKNVNPALVDAANSSGCVQTRKKATVGGNIATASSTVDVIPPLMVYDAYLLLQSIFGERQVSLEDFIKDPGKTDLKQGEFIHSVSFSPFKGKWGSGFIKLEKREGTRFIGVSAAAAVTVSESGRINQVRLAVGTVTPIVVRCRLTEDYLSGRKATTSVYEKASELCQEELEPIVDLTSTDSQQLRFTGVLLHRVLENAIVQARGRI